MKTQPEATHEIYGYITNTGEPLEMTDPEPVVIDDDKLRDVFSQIVGVREDAKAGGVVDAVAVCEKCKGTGTFDYAKNRHYTDVKVCDMCQGVPSTPIKQRVEGTPERWVMPNHDTTLLLRKLPSA